MLSNFQRHKNQYAGVLNWTLHLQHLEPRLYANDQAGLAFQFLLLRSQEVAGGKTGTWISNRPSAAGPRSPVRSFRAKTDMIVPRRPAVATRPRPAYTVDLSLNESLLMAVVAEFG